MKNEDKLIDALHDVAESIQLNPDIIFCGSENELNEFIDAFSNIPEGVIDSLNQTDKVMKNNMPDFIEKVQTKDFRRKLNRKKWKSQRGRK